MTVTRGWTGDRNSLSKSLNDPSVFALKSKRKVVKSIWNTTVYTKKRVRNSREIKRKGRKRIACVYAYNDGGNYRNKVQAMQGCVVRNGL